MSWKLLEAKIEHLYWTPCAAHCLDLMLEDIGKKVPKFLEQAFTMVRCFEDCQLIGYRSTVNSISQFGASRFSGSLCYGSWNRGICQNRMCDVNHEIGNCTSIGMI
uniref:DUF659 domain-containing protein n=1 Tax=Lactuca sativa TaxID=4236 RepID=A0A9R1W1A8_LACSA|nr:hypothetical protein LSAT_V11C400161270 [Lactuca sativa]